MYDLLTYWITYTLGVLILFAIPLFLLPSAVRIVIIQVTGDKKLAKRLTCWLVDDKVQKRVVTKGHIRVLGVDIHGDLVLLMLALGLLLDFALVCYVIKTSETVIAFVTVITTFSYHTVGAFHTIGLLYVAFIKTAKYVYKLNKAIENLKGENK